MSKSPVILPNEQSNKFSNTKSKIFLEGDSMFSKLAFRLFVFTGLLVSLSMGATRPAVERALVSLNREAGHAVIPGEFLARFATNPGDLSGIGVRSKVDLGGNLYRLEFNQDLTLAEVSSRLAGKADRVEPNVLSAQQNLATQTSPSTPATWLDALNVSSLVRLAPSTPSVKTRVVFIDSGLSCAVLALNSASVNLALSKSWVDNSPCTDEADHGTKVASTYLQTVMSGSSSDFVSLKILGADNTGTLDSLVSALNQLASWESKTTIVNMSLQNFPESDIISGIMDRLQNHVLFVSCAGNNSSSSPNYPGYYGHKINVLSVGSAESNGQLSTYSDWGSWVNIAGFGSVVPSIIWGTSYAAPQAVAIAELLLTQKPDMEPSLVKKVLLNGGLYQQNLAGIIGDPTTGLQARTLNGGGSLQVLQRLEGITLTGYDSGLSVSEDIHWLSQFVLQVQLVDPVGNKLLVPATVSNSRITFSAPSGEVSAQLVIEGVTFGNQLRLTVPRRYKPI